MVCLQLGQLRLDEGGVRLADLPHGLLVLRCYQMHTVWVLDEFILINFRHAGHFRVLPLRRVLLVEESPLLVTKGLLHLLMLLVEGR